jgi:hypothetical protein
MDVTFKRLRDPGRILAVTATGADVDEDLRRKNLPARNRQCCTAEGARVRVPGRRLTLHAF